MLFEPSRVSTPSRTWTYSATRPAWPPAAPHGPWRSRSASTVKVVGCSKRKSLRSPSPPRNRPGPSESSTSDEARDLDGVVELRLLDRRVLRVLPVRLHRVRAVARVPRAVAAGERLVEARVAPAGEVERAEARLAHHPLRPGGKPVGEGGQERAEHHLDEARLRLPAADDRRGPGAVRHRALGCVEPEEPVEAVVDGQVRVDQALERVRAGGERLRVGRVDRARGAAGPSRTCRSRSPSAPISTRARRRTGSSV